METISCMNSINKKVLFVSENCYTIAIRVQCVTLIAASHAQSVFDMEHQVLGMYVASSSPMLW